MTKSEQSLTVKRSLDQLEKLVELIKSFTESHQFDGSINYLLNLAAEELFTNMVKYTPSGSGDIDMTLAKEGTEIVVTFVDHGVPEFDIRSAPSAAGDQPLHARRIGGLGLHLIREMMDEVDYQYRDGNSVIILKKNLENLDA